MLHWLASANMCIRFSLYSHVTGVSTKLISRSELNRNIGVLLKMYGAMHPIARCAVFISPTGSSEDDAVV